MGDLGLLAEPFHFGLFVLVRPFESNRRVVHVTHNVWLGRRHPFQLTAKFEGLFCPLVSSHPLPAHRDTGGEGGGGG